MTLSSRWTFFFRIVDHILTSNIKVYITKNSSLAGHRIRLDLVANLEEFFANYITNVRHKIKGSKYMLHLST